VNFDIVYHKVRGGHAVEHLGLLFIAELDALSFYLTMKITNTMHYID
jgi:hypothetical protein